VARGLGLPVGVEPGAPTPTVPAIVQAPSPTSPACLDTVFNGLVVDAHSDALLGGVKVTASFGASAETSPDGEYNLLVCYDSTVHAAFALTFEKDGYESASLNVATADYPGISFQVEDVGLNAVQSACLDSVFNGLVFDGQTNALLGGVKVTASFGASVETSPDGEYNLQVCYDDAQHRAFALTFEKEGYASASLDVQAGGYPGIRFAVADMALYTLAPTPEPTLFEPPRQTPIPTLFQPPRQTPLPTPTPTLFQPPRQTPIATSALGNGAGDLQPTAAATPGSAEPGVTPAPTGAPPNTLPVTGLPISLPAGQTLGFVLLAIALMLIAAGVWPQNQDDDWNSL
jgi:hypothetical protein